MKRTADVVLEPIMFRHPCASSTACTGGRAQGRGRDADRRERHRQGGLARRIHELSNRERAVRPINCAAIPESLFESELFGHERGAFTGATERAAEGRGSEGGTLFLDELGELPLAMQAKLLRFLENRRFMRVGGNTKVSVDTRFVCATLRPLEEEVRLGRFRADLYYRIRGIELISRRFVIDPPNRTRSHDSSSRELRRSTAWSRPRLDEPRSPRCSGSLGRATSGSFATRWSDSACSGPAFPFAS